MKRFFCFLTLILYLISAHPRYQRFTAAFWGSFDTVVVVTAYCGSQRQFDAAFDAAAASFASHGRYYDKFEYSDQLVNIAYLNRHAAMGEVAVGQSLFSLLQYAVRAEWRTGGLVSPVFGAVSSLWQRQISRSQGASPPSSEQLSEAKKHTGCRLLSLDEVRHTVLLKSDKAQIDAGAFAKGYALEEMVRVFSRAGISRVAASAGGNVKALEPPPGRSFWEIGVQSPSDAIFSASAPSALIKLRNSAAATSGGYQRGFWHNGTRYHHLIDPETLYPANHFESVTAVCRSAADADLFSTALFLASPQISAALAEREGVAALWLSPDGGFSCNGAMQRLLDD